MSEFLDKPAEAPDEFDEFLRTSTDIEITDQINTELINNVLADFNKVLEVYNYRDLIPGTTRYRKELAEMSQYVFSELDYSDSYDDLPDDIKTEIRDVARLQLDHRYHDEHLFVLEVINLDVEWREFINNNSVDDIKLSVSVIIDKKKRLYADALVVWGYDSTHPLLASMNHFLTGPVLSPDDPQVVLYVAENLDNAEKIRAANQLGREKLAKAYELVGINEEFLDADLAIKVNHLYETAVNCAAFSMIQRDESLRDMARRFGIDSQTAEQLIDFFNLEIPVQG